MLAGPEDLSVIAEAGNFSEALCAVYALDLDIVVLDLSTTGRDRMELGDHVKVIRTAARLLFPLEA